MHRVGDHAHPARAAGSTFYAGAWINVVVGAIAAWTAAVWLVPVEEFTWQAVPYFALSGLIGTTGGRLFRVFAIQKVGAPWRPRSTT